MRKLNYKMIVSDFDGTLIDDNQNIPEKVKSKIDEYVSAGGIFAVCTGRMLRSILPRVRELGLKGLVIASQGSVIADIDSGKLLKNSGLNHQQSVEICKNIEELGLYINFYCGDEIYTNLPPDDEGLRRYEMIIGLKTRYIDQKVSDYVIKNKMHCQKIASIVKSYEREQVYLELQKRLGEKYDVTCSAKVLVEVSPLNETKGEAVKFLCKHFGISIEECVAVGDNLNDLSMILAAGIGVAVGNADVTLKSNADFISISNNDGAIAQIIEKYGFA